MSLPTFAAFEDRPLPSWRTGSCLPPAGRCWGGGGVAGRWGSYRPAAAFPMTGRRWTKQQHTLVVVTRQEGQRAESSEKTQASPQHKALLSEL